MNATKGDQGRRRDPGSSPSGEPLKVAPPSASPAEPSPGRGSSEAGRRRERVDDEDAAGHHRGKILYAAKVTFFKLLDCDLLYTNLKNAIILITQFYMQFHSN